MMGKKMMKRNQRALDQPLWSLRRKLSTNTQMTRKIQRRNSEARKSVQNTPSSG
jgi:hypothetical protein